MNPRWKQRPPGSTWGDFGADDQNGRLNLITPEKVRQGVAEVKQGLTFCLSLPLDLPGGNVLSSIRVARHHSRSIPSPDLFPLCRRRDRNPWRSPARSRQ